MKDPIDPWDVDDIRNDAAVCGSAQKEAAEISDWLVQKQMKEFAPVF